VVQQELAEDIDMDPGTKKPPMNIRELMKKKRGVKGRELIRIEPHPAPEGSHFVRDEAEPDADADVDDPDTECKVPKKLLAKEKERAKTSNRRKVHLVSLFLPLSGLIN
jgi:hypothetical protein